MSYPLASATDLEISQSVPLRQSNLTRRRSQSKRGKSQTRASVLRISFHSEIGFALRHLTPRRSRSISSVHFELRCRTWERSRRPSSMAAHCNCPTPPNARHTHTRGDHTPHNSDKFARKRHGSVFLPFYYCTWMESFKCVYEIMPMRASTVPISFFVLKSSPKRSHEPEMEEEEKR